MEVIDLVFIATRTNARKTIKMKNIIRTTVCCVGSNVIELHDVFQTWNFTWPLAKITLTPESRCLLMSARFTVRLWSYFFLLPILTRSSDESSELRDHVFCKPLASVGPDFSDDFVVVSVREISVRRHERIKTNAEPIHNKVANPSTSKLTSSGVGNF